VCPSSTCSYSPVSVAQILAVQSNPAVIIFVPWGLNETFDISPSCPLRELKGKK